MTSTLSEKINLALADEMPLPFTLNQRPRARIAQICKHTKDSRLFGQFVIFTIVVVGVQIGVDTNRDLTCKRLGFRNRGLDDDELLAQQAECSSNDLSTAVALGAQIIFTVEIVVKLLAEGDRSWHFCRQTRWNLE
jgi:hypothetical protein